MKSLVIFLLVVFLLVDAFLAARLFYPRLIPDIVQKISYHQITVSSEIPNIKVSLADKKYLNEKLKKLDFWGDKKVANYAKPQLEYVTVERLKLILTNKPQNLTKGGDPKSKNSIVYSYGQIYDRSTKTMTLLLHLNHSFNSSVPLKERYTGLALFALYNTIHPRTPDNKESYLKGLGSFAPEYVDTRGKYYIFNIN